MKGFPGLDHIRHVRDRIAPDEDAGVDNVAGFGGETVETVDEVEGAKDSAGVTNPCLAETWEEEHPGGNTDLVAAEVVYILDFRMSVVVVDTW